MIYDENNIFAKILRGEISPKLVEETAHSLAFLDHAPKAPHHILVIPKGKYTSFDDFSAKASDAEIADFTKLVGKRAREAGLAESGYRLIANHGVNGGQEVPHFHVHILGGEKLGPMLGN